MPRESIESLVCCQKDLVHFQEIFNGCAHISVVADDDISAFINKEILFVTKSAWSLKLKRFFAAQDSEPYFVLVDDQLKSVPKNFSLQGQGYTPLFCQLRDLKEAEAVSLLRKQAIERKKSLRRMTALKRHRSRGWDHEKNPALFLITNLVKECCLSNKYEDVLSSIMSLRSVLEFQFSTLFILDESSRPLKAWAAVPSGTNKIHYSTLALGTLKGKISLEEDLQVLSPFDPGINPIICGEEPWSSAVAVKIKAQISHRRKGAPHSAVAILFRNELLPFSDKESWLLEMALGPLTLAVEKAGVLETIQESSREWRATFDAISEPITVISESFEIVKANREFAKAVGQDIKTLKGKKCYSLLAGRRSVCENCPTTAHGQGPQKVYDKQKKDFLVWSYNLRAKKENFNFQFYRNLEKENQLRSALIQSEKMAALGNLVSSIAHEVNNPLAGILSTCQIMAQEIDGPLLPKEDVQELIDASIRCKAIIDNLLGFTGETESAQSHDLAKIIKNTLVLCKSALSQIQLRLTIDNRLPPFTGSPSMLQQILFNLITNAAHAMNGKGEIIITAERHAESLIISIVDRGPGIDEQRLQYLFDPFHTAKAEGHGTGLGLSIVKSLTKKLRGEISVKSVINKGTSFELKFPSTVSDNG